LNELKQISTKHKRRETCFPIWRNERVKGENSFKTRIN